MSLATLPVTEVKGVGDKLATTLSKLGIKSVQDLIFHLPSRYLDRTQITSISKLQLNVYSVVQGQVLNNNIQFGRRRSLAVTLEDETGEITLRFYHFSATQKNNLEPGRTVRCYGEPRLGSRGIELYHPEYEFINEQNASPELNPSLTPIYPLTEGVSQLRLRKLIPDALTLMDKHPPEELLPRDLHSKFATDTLAQILHYLHFPPPNTDIDTLVCGTHPYMQKLAFEELLAHFLVKQQQRLVTQNKIAPRIHVDHPQLIDTFLAQLPFSPTGAQDRVFNEIKNDLYSTQPMLRMIQGDVGSGKTLVAALAALTTVASGYQVAIVAPTEILAEQHFANLATWFEPLNVQTTWLVGKLTAKQRANALACIQEGAPQVIIGTHALLQEDVHIPLLGLAVVDEQHRFGVKQRLSLRKANTKGETPHQLVMTATPIPRTLAMTAYADMDYSVIDELPPGRIPINTALIPQQRKAEVILRVGEACLGGQQAYWVCPLVEESETLSAANAEETSANLVQTLSALEIGLVHGRMKPETKDQVMQAFKQGTLHVLVATTVIEVGVDVPNANLMVIENPERLGLAQLHQLRGRVGRGQHASHCILLYGDKLSNQAKERLKILRESTDGFAIAERDLALRGPGELLGTRQSGELAYRIASLERDAHLIELVQQTGRELIEHNSDNITPLINRWVGQNQTFSEA